MSELDKVDHIAVEVADIQKSVDWYRERFSFNVLYQDETWAFLEFENIKLAFVLPNQHPPHIAFCRADAEKHGKLKTHRDGTKSIYIRDNSGNAIEILKS